MYVINKVYKREGHRKRREDKTSFFFENKNCEQINQHFFKKLNNNIKLCTLIVSYVVWISKKRIKSNMGFF